MTGVQTCALPISSLPFINCFAILLVHSFYRDNGIGTHQCATATRDAFVRGETMARVIPDRIHFRSIQFQNMDGTGIYAQSASFTAILIERNDTSQRESPFIHSLRITQESTARIVEFISCIKSTIKRASSMVKIIGIFTCFENSSTS